MRVAVPIPSLVAIDGEGEELALFDTPETNGVLPTVCVEVGDDPESPSARALIDEISRRLKLGCTVTVDATTADLDRLATVARDRARTWLL